MIHNVEMRDGRGDRWKGRKGGREEGGKVRSLKMEERGWTVLLWMLELAHDGGLPKMAHESHESTRICSEVMGHYTNRGSACLFVKISEIRGLYL